MIETTPYKYLLEKTIEIEKFIFYSKFRFFESMLDDFSWVYGLSEVEIKDYIQLYILTKEEILNSIERTGNIKLKTKLSEEISNLPIINLDKFIVDTNHVFFIFKLLVPFKKIITTYQFKNNLSEIKYSAERMYNLIDNKEWLDF